MRRPLSAMFLAVLASTAVAGSVAAKPTVFNIRLEPEAAAPGASGHAQITLDPEAGLVCYNIKWTGVPAPVTGGHIHAAGGEIVVSLFGGPLGDATAYPGDKFRVSGCVSADEATINAILTNPSDFYLNLHIGSTFTSVLRGNLA